MGVLLLLRSAEKASLFDLFQSIVSTVVTQSETQKLEDSAEAKNLNKI